MNIPNFFISQFLDINQPMDNSQGRFSTLAILIRGARKLTGRNLSTGVYEMNEINFDNITDQTYFPFQFSGLINYLIFLEQIGSIFKPKNAIPIIRTNGIFCALTYFSNLGNNEKEVVKALRDSLTHKFGLATELKRGNSGPFKFIFSIERNPCIIQLPIKIWGGDFTDVSVETSTLIHIHDLIDVIEEVYTNVIEENKNENLDIILKSGIDELLARYTITS
jgi:hypothetical protein